ncbi:unnamed protein product [Symbiodinium natans]|uniref:Uncharacterized protein n=1 Tax=Symbiodinium natans TaxID=878477 RepID=A0A812UZU5_9DINO|nr:unnamed protein product [Symbiodinium natans]
MVVTATTVKNDLRTPIEVNIGSDLWQTIYPERFCQVELEVVRVRLVEDPGVKGSYQVEGGGCPGCLLRASSDFEAFSRHAQDKDSAEQREVEEEAKRREEAKRKKKEMIQNMAAEKRNQATGWFARCFSFVCLCLIPATGVVYLSTFPPKSSVMAACFAASTVPICGSLSCWVAIVGSNKYGLGVLTFGKHEARYRWASRLTGGLAMAAVVYRSVRNAQHGFWWTALIVCPAAFCGCFAWCPVALRVAHWHQKTTLEWEHTQAQREVGNRTIRFEGSVIKEQGRPCVASWPGKYAAAWDALVSQSRDGDVSAAVVFLPEGTDDYGVHDNIPTDEGLYGTCWCTPLYGEEKPWGCRWFSNWKENIETAVQSEAVLEVYYFVEHVGRGKVASFNAAGDENLKRETLNQKQKRFEQSPEFKQALDAGLGNLSKDLRGDSSSPYSREVRRLFLASLPEPERRFLEDFEGLGNSQKAEVAWLERKGYAYQEVDVSVWLRGEGGETYVPAFAEQKVSQKQAQVTADSTSQHAPDIITHL